MEFTHLDTKCKPSGKNILGFKNYIFFHSTIVYLQDRTQDRGKKKKKKSWLYKIFSLANSENSKHITDLH